MCDDEVNDAIIDLYVCLTDVDVDLDVVSFNVLIIDDIVIYVVDGDVEVGDVVFALDVDQCVVDVVCDVLDVDVKVDDHDDVVDRRICW